MEQVLQVITKEKLAEMLGTVSGKFRLPLMLLDTANHHVVRVGMDCQKSMCPAGSMCPSGTFLSTVPLHFKGDMAGNLAVCLAPGETADYLEAAAYCLETSIRLEAENLDLSAEIVRVYDELALIYTLTSKLGSEMDVDSICARVLEEVGKILVVQNMSILLVDPMSHQIYARLSTGRDRESAAQFRADAASSLIGQIMGEGEPITICDITATGGPSLPYPVKSILCVPFVTDGKGIGMLVASDKLSGEEFWSPEIKLLGGLSSEIAASIRKAQLYEEISDIFLHTVEALASAIDAKDPYTYGHSRRVASLSAAICAELGMSKRELRYVELAAILHDIGKIGTPEIILQKPGRLNNEEMDKVKEHPSQGAHILSTITEFSDIIRWIKHHHEWYDGKGYPDRIAAEHIPLQARVITIADAFDAMTSDRPYRKGMPYADALKIMEEFSGKQFDPHLLETFKKICDAGKIDCFIKDQGGSSTMRKNSSQTPMA